MQTIDTYDFRGKKSLIRLDFNVPLNEKLEITDDTRMKMCIRDRSLSTHCFSNFDKATDICTCLLYTS